MEPKWGREHIIGLFVAALVGAGIGFAFGYVIQPIRPNPLIWLQYRTFDAATFAAFGAAIVAGAVYVWRTDPLPVVLSRYYFLSRDHQDWNDIVRKRKMRIPI